MRKNVIRFTLRIVPELNEKLEVIGKEKGMTKTNVILNILWDAVNKKPNRKAG